MYFIDIVLDLLFCIVLYCFIVLMFFLFFFLFLIFSFVVVYRGVPVRAPTGLLRFNQYIYVMCLKGRYINPSINIMISLFFFHPFHFFPFITCGGICLRKIGRAHV